MENSLIFIQLHSSHANTCNNTTTLIIFIKFPYHSSVDAHSHHFRSMHLPRDITQTTRNSNNKLLSTRTKISINRGVGTETAYSKKKKTSLNLFQANACSLPSVCVSHKNHIAANCFEYANGCVGMIRRKKKPKHCNTFAWYYIIMLLFRFWLYEE